MFGGASPHQTTHNSPLSGGKLPGRDGPTAKLAEAFTPGGQCPRRSEPVSVHKREGRKSFGAVLSLKGIAPAEKVWEHLTLADRHSRFDSFYRHCNAPQVRCTERCTAPNPAALCRPRNDHLRQIGAGGGDQDLG